MPHPRVSVIIPNYNHARYLRERVESILAQTLGDFEVILLDDASTDSSHSVLARYYGRPRVRIAVNANNSGSVFAQWNKGIAMARGDYVWIAESDDSADPEFLETLVSVLEDHPSVGFAYCQSRMINREGAFLGTASSWTSDLHSSRWEADFVNTGLLELRDYLSIKNTVPNASAVLARRTILRQVTPVETSYRLCGDWLHWGKMLLHGDIAYVARPLNNWRLESSHARTSRPGVLEWKEGQRIIRYFAAQLGYGEQELCRSLLAFADRCLDWLGAST